MGLPVVGGEIQPTALNFQNYGGRGNRDSRGEDQGLSGLERLVGNM